MWLSEKSDFTEKEKTGSLPKPFIKIISRGITEINVEDKTIKIIEESAEEYLGDLQMGKLFSKPQEVNLRQKH